MTQGPDWDELAENADSTPRAAIAELAGMLEVAGREPVATAYVVQWSDDTWTVDHAGNRFTCLGMLTVLVDHLRLELGNAPEAPQ